MLDLPVEEPEFRHWLNNIGFVLMELYQGDRDSASHAVCLSFNSLFDSFQKGVSPVEAAKIIKQRALH